MFRRPDECQDRKQKKTMGACLSNNKVKEDLMAARRIEDELRLDVDRWRCEANRSNIKISSLQMALSEKEQILQHDKRKAAVLTTKKNELIEGLIDANITDQYNVDDKSLSEKLYWYDVLTFINVWLESQTCLET